MSAITTQIDLFYANIYIVYKSLRVRGPGSATELEKRPYQLSVGWEGSVGGKPFIYMVSIRERLIIISGA